MDETAHRSAESPIVAGEGDLAGRRLGPYEILRELGRGSNGVVYEALLPETRERFALKVLPANITLNEKTVARFRREAQAASGLAHSGIVKVHEVDEADGTHYFAMEYVEGVSLDRYAQTREMTVREAARLIRDSARALHHAHEHGVVHRDVKPGNLLVRADGHVLVSDFGLARLDKSTTLTSTDAIVGTPKYMSPEQILAEKGSVDRRADVYALGVTLYEMVTGSHPFAGDTVQAFLKSVLEADPRPPRKISRRIPRDIQTIILTAMDRDLDRRYQTALSLAEDLDRFLNKRPIRARPLGIAPRALALVRRRRVTVLTGALGITILAATIVMLLILRSGSARSSYDGLVRTATESLSASTGWSGEEAPLKLAEVAETLDEAIALTGRRPEAFLLRARLRCYEKRFDDAAADLSSAKSRGATQEDLAPVRALRALGTQDWRAAIAFADLALRRSPRSAELYFIRGAAYYATERTAEARADLEECLSIEPGHQDAATLLGDVGLRTGDTEVTSRVRTFREILEGFGRAGEEGAGILGAFTTLVREAARASPGLSSIGRSLFRELVISRELAAIQEGEAREEVALTTKEIDAGSTDHRLHVRRGRARIRLGEIDAALEDFREAIRKDEETSESETATDWEPFFWSALLRVTSPDESLWEENIAHTSADYAVRLAPDSEKPRAKDVLAEVLFRMGQKERALAVIEKLAEEDPEGKDYYRRRAAYFRG